MAYETEIRNIDYLTRRINTISNEELTKKEITLLTKYLNEHKEYLENKR